MGLGAVGEASPSTPATTPSHPAAPTTAVRTLTENVLALAATVRDINGGLRGRLALDVEGDGPRDPRHRAGSPAGPEAGQGQGRLTTPGAGEFPRPLFAEGQP